MTRIGDTSAIYALFSLDDVHHDEARSAFDDIEPVQIPVPILVESADLIASRQTHAVAHQAVQGLLALPHVSVAGPVHLDAVLKIHGQANGKLSLADAYVVQTCRTLGATPLTFDKEIQKRAALPP